MVVDRESTHSTFLCVKMSLQDYTYGNAIVYKYKYIFYEKQRGHTQQRKSTCLNRQVAIKLIIGTPLIWSRVFYFYAHSVVLIYTLGSPRKLYRGAAVTAGKKHGLVIILLRWYFRILFYFSRLSFQNNGLEIYTSLFWCFFSYFTQGDKSTETSKCWDIKNDNGKRLLPT